MMHTLMQSYVNLLLPFMTHLKTVAPNMDLPTDVLNSMWLEYHMLPHNPRNFSARYTTPWGVLNFGLGTDVQPEVSTTTL